MVDEKEAPVAGARVSLQWSDLSSNGASSANVATDASGQFQLTGKRGNGLTIRISKDDYYTPRNVDGARFENTRFWDENYYQADSNKPIPFHLRRKGKGVALSTGEVYQDIPTNGMPVRFDLLDKGNISPNGQLEIAAFTNTEQYPPRIFDWSASFVIHGGGLIEYNAEFPFEAPKVGYQSRVDFHENAKSTDWQHSIDESYFVRFGNPPMYGRIQLHINGDSQRIAINYWINQSGSRNLEPSSTTEDDKQ